MPRWTSRAAAEARTLEAPNRCARDSMRRLAQVDLLTTQVHQKERVVTVQGEQNQMDSSTKEPHFVLGLWGVRYQVKDVQRSIHFYTHTLGFNLDQQNLPAFGQVSIGDLKLILSGPGASGSRAMPDGRQQEPGGWNRVVLRVKDCPHSFMSSRTKEYGFATSWKSVLAASKFRWMIRTAIRSSCSSLPCGKQWLHHWSCECSVVAA
jgi:hypothetical protein